MKKEHEQIHRLLDGDVPAAEKEMIIGRTQDDPVLRKEFDDLSNAVEMLAREGRMNPPLAFTASVMRKLPRPGDPFPARLKRFLFGSRVLRWNMAAALAIVLLTAVTTILMMKQLTYRDPGPLSATVPSGEQAALVRLTFVAPAAQRVSVAGDFNKWRTDSHVMKRQNGMWTIDLPLKPGMYTYMFIVDGEHWITDPRAESYRDDGFGYQNAVMRVSL
jgi:anti-sigma factor RsiW